MNPKPSFHSLSESDKNQGLPQPTVRARRAVPQQGRGTNRFLTHLTILLLGAGLCACSATSSTLAPIDLPPQLFDNPGRIVDTTLNQLLTPADVANKLTKVRVIYVAEQHDQIADHEVQLLVIWALLSRGQRPGIALEMVESTKQPILDEFNLHRMDTDGLKNTLEWTQSWGFDFELYRPIFDLAQKFRLPLVAINAPRTLVSRVAKVGRDGLTEVEKQQVPSLQSGTEPHRNYIRQAYDSHPHHGGLDFDRFYQAQLVWDETMTSHIVDWLRTHPYDKPLVVLAGRGHIEFGLGVPLRVYNLEKAPYRIVFPVVRGTLADYSDWLSILSYPEKRADYFWESTTIPAQTPKSTDEMALLPTYKRYSTPDLLHPGRVIPPYDSPTQFFSTVDVSAVFDAQPNVW